MQIRTEIEGGVLIAHLNGEFTHDYFLALLEALSKMLSEKWSCLRLDFDKVSAIDASGLAALYIVKADMQKIKKKIELVNFNDSVQEKLTSYGFDKILAVSNSATQQLSNSATQQLSNSATESWEIKWHTALSGKKVACMSVILAQRARKRLMRQLNT